jgi:hypothetical protein
MGQGWPGLHTGHEHVALSVLGFPGKTVDFRTRLSILKTGHLT